MSRQNLPMDSAATVKLSRALRWIVALGLVVVGTLLIRSLLDAATPPDAIHTLALLAIALAAYAGVLYPPTGSLPVGVAALVCLLWAWAARRTSVLGWDAAASALILSVAVWQQQRRSRRVLRLQQALEDLSEECTVKDQAMTLATQTREALRKKLARYTQLQTIAEELSDMTDLVAIAQLAVERACSLIGKSDVCLLFLVDQAQQLSLVASKKREAVRSIRAKHGDQFDRHVLRANRPLLVNDVRRDFRFTVTVSPEREISSVVACPLVLDQSPSGVLRLDSARPSAYTQDDLRLLDILLDLVATAVTNAKLFAQTQQLATTDSLTALSLRRPFLEQLTRELIRASRSREPVCLLLLDVDHFKAYNDAFGHTAGDVILKGVAEVLRTVAPPGASLARYGGEEFIVLLPRASRVQGGEVAEKIRHLVEQQVQLGGRHPVPFGANQRRTRDLAAAEAAGSHPHAPAPFGGGVTVSVGVAQFPDDAQVELELIRLADQRLYQAKRAGRNLVCYQ